jgi:hypothetical protein
MRAVAHDPKFAAKVGISQDVGAEFVAADKRAALLRRFEGESIPLADGGPVPWDVSRLQRGQTPDKWRAQQEKAKVEQPDLTWDQILGRLSDTATGLGHGAVGTALGWPGDLEKLLAYELPALFQPQGLSGLIAPESHRTLFPTSEEVRGYLPKPTQFQIPYDKNPGVELGQWAPISPGHIAKAARSTLRTAKPAAQWVGGALADATRRGVEEGAGPLGAALAPARPLYAVRPRGGNFDDQSLDSTLSRLHNFEAEGAEADPVNAWINKTLRNYIRKDLGSPADP